MSDTPSKGSAAIRLSSEDHAVFSRADLILAIKDELNKRYSKWYHKTAVQVTVAALLVAFSSTLAVIAIILSNNVKTEVDAAQIQILGVQADVATAQNQVSILQSGLDPLLNVDPLKLTNTFNQLNASATSIVQTINSIGNFSQRLADVETFVGFSAQTAAAGFTLTAGTYTQIQFPNVLLNSLENYATYDGTSVLTVHVGGVWQVQVGGYTTTAAIPSGSQIGFAIYIGSAPSTVGGGVATGPVPSVVLLGRASPGDTISVSGYCSPDDIPLGASYPFFLQAQFIGL